MKSLFSILVFALFFILSTVASLSAQSGGCGTVVTPETAQVELWFQKKIRESQFTMVDEPIFIRITPHIVRRDDKTGGLPESVVHRAVEELNNDLGKRINVFFYVCKFNYIDNTKYYFFDSSQEPELVKKHNVLNTVNVYFVGRTAYFGSEVCGYSAFPTEVEQTNQMQATVIANHCMEYRTLLPHELGHFFNLYHTFETFIGKELVNGSNCNTAGDLVCDTKADPKLGYQTVTNDCRYVGKERDENGDLYTPDPLNHMTYGRHSCGMHFSEGQLNRAKKTILLMRPYLREKTNPTLNQTDTMSFCLGESITLTAPRGLIYQWSTGAVTPNIVVSPQKSTVYSVTVQQAADCNSTQTWFININEINISQSKSVVCPGASTVLRAIGGTDYMWQPSAGLDRTVGSTVKASPTRTTTYTVRATLSSCTISDTITVRVELPDIRVKQNQISICQGNSIEVQALGGARYEWIPQTGVKLSQNGAVATLSPTVSTTYTVEGFRDECSSNATVTVNVTQNKIRVAFTDTLVCYGEKITMRASGGQNYRWNPVGDLTNPTDSVITITAYRNMQYIVSDQDTACFQPAVVNIRIYEPIIVTFDRKPVSTPEGFDGELTIHVKGGIPSYLYSINDGAFQSDSVFRGLKVGMQKVVVKDGRGCEKIKHLFVNIRRAEDCIIPEFRWVKRSGSSETDEGNSISRDAKGNFYVTGYFSATADFGNYTLVSKGTQDIFIAKYDTFGNCLWAKRAGGSDSDVGWSISADIVGNVYVIGLFEGTADFGVYTLVSKGGQDIFIAKYDASGKCLWAKRSGSSGIDRAQSICTDAERNVYVTGAFSATGDFGDYSLVSNGSIDIFIAKYDASGNCLWVKRVGNQLDDQGNRIICDNEGNIYVTGNFYKTVDFGNFTLESIRTHNIFIAKYDASGNCLWAKRAGGNVNNDSGWGICTDNEGNVYVTGDFFGTADFGDYILVSKGQNDIFIAKYDVVGKCLWAKRSGSSGIDRALSVCSDAEGNIYATGVFTGTADFGDYTLESKGGQDIFIAKYDALGMCLWAKRLGSNGNDRARSIFTDAEANIYLTGGFTGTADFGKEALKSKGGYDIFLTKLSCTADTVAPTCDFTVSGGGDLMYPCTGTPVTLQGSVGTNGAVWEWFPAEGLYDPKSLTPKASPKETTTYTLVAKKDTCTATAEITVTVPKRQAFGLDTNRVAYCAGGSPQVFLKNADSLTFEFQPSEGINFTAPDKITVTATQTNVFQIIGKRDGYCDYVVDLTVVVHPQPSVFSTPQASDGSNNGKITASAADGTAPYQFALDGNNFNSQFVFENLTPGQHILKVKDANGCQNQDTVWVEDCSQLSVNAGENVTICLGTSVEINPVILPSNGFKSYLWLPTLGLSDPNALQVTASPISTTTYTLTVSNDQGCNAVDSVTVTVKQLPIVNAGTDASICLGESVSLSATSDAVIFRWLPETGLDNPTILNPKASPRRTTVYTLTADNGTCSTYDEMIVYVQELKLLSQEYICKNGSVVLDGGSGFDTYDWQPISGLSNTKIQKPTASPTQTTTYTLTVKKGICTLTDSVTVNVMQAQAIENQTLCTGNAVQLWAKGGTRYQWTPANGLSNPNSPYPVATPKVTTTYTVAVTDEFLCSDAVTVQVSVLSENSPLLTVDSVKEASCSGCIDGKIAVRASGGLPPYQYSIDGGSFQPTGTFTGLGAGSYLVTVRDANGCRDDSLIRVMLLNTPCEIPTNLKVSASNTSARVSWQAVPKTQAYQVFYREIGIPAWHEEITTDNFIVLQPLTSGKEYETYVISLCENQVFGPPSDTILFIPKNCNMKASYTIQNISCTGKRNGSIRIDSISGGLPPYTLTFNGIPTDERVFPALAAGSYRIKTISSNGCTKEYTVTVGIEAGTDAPKIVMRNDTLFCQPAHFISYQWFRNGSSVSQNVRDAVYFTNRVAGSYVVRVQHSDTCIYRSEPFEYVFNSLQEVPETPLFEIYPNPFEDQTTIRFNTNRPEQISIQVFDTRGALVYSRSEIDSGTTEVINLQLQTSGIYLLKIKTGSHIYTAKLVKF